jgi:hypothetical protein
MLTPPTAHAAHRVVQGQAHLVPSHREPRGKKSMAPVHDDILLAKLRPGQVTNHREGDVGSKKCSV